MVLMRGDGLTSGNPVTRFIFAITYVAVVAVLILYTQRASFVVRRNWFLMALVFLALVSCLWAETPGLVLQRSIGVLGTTLLGVAFATRLNLEEQLRVFSWVFRILAILSLGCVLFFPSLGISQSVETLGDWQGVFGYKNALGAMMALSILVEWHRPADRFYSTIVKWFTLVISAVLLYFSNSITSLLAVVASLSLIEIYRFAKQRLRVPFYAIIVVALFSVVCGVTVLLAASNTVTGAVGRASNFTGRTAIWNIVLSDISQRPILGYGYSGFWYGSSQESSVVDEALGMPIMYSHNGYLESLLNLGAVGFFFIVLFLGRGVIRAYFCAERSWSRANVWPLAFLTFFLLYNLGECMILMQEVQWAMCVAVVATADAALLAPTTNEQEDKMILTPINEPA